MAATVRFVGKQPQIHVAVIVMTSIGGRILGEVIIGIGSNLVVPLGYHRVNDVVLKVFQCRLQTGPVRVGFVVTTIIVIARGGGSNQESSGMLVSDPRATGVIPVRGLPQEGIADVGGGRIQPTVRDGLCVLVLIDGLAED